MRMFGSDRLAGLMDRMGFQEGEMIEHSMISKSIERAQKKVEENNFGIRKRLLEYDDVMNKQRTVIYARRRHALMGERIGVDIVNTLYDTAAMIVGNNHQVLDFDGFKGDMLAVFAMDAPVTEDEFRSMKAEKIVDRVAEAAYEVFVGGTEISLDIILTYLPVSLLYIGSMAMGYLGLRYIELSISSPICNSSGALVAVMTLFMVGFSEYSPLALGAVALVCVGAIGLGVVDYFEDEELRAERQKSSNFKYSKSLIALALPVAYCILDAVGTFADNRVLEILDESSANVAYELTFLFVGILCFIYVVLIKKDKLI